MRATPLSAVVLACLLALTACGDSDSDSGSADDTGSTTTATDEADTSTTAPGETTSSAPDEEVSAEGDDSDTSAPPVTTLAGGKPEVTAGEGEPPTELQIDDLVVGTGEEAVAGAPVEVHYVGVLYEDGTEFDSSWDRGAPIDFTLGEGQVIEGWDQGVEGMQVGGRRQLVIPPDLAYGETGSGELIGPDATLVFVVDLVSVFEPVPAPDAADEPSVEVPDPLPTELVVEDLQEGDGDEAVEGTTAVVNVVGVTASDGEVFESSWQRGQPLSFAVGLGQIIPGLDQGVEGMQVGGRRQLVIPPELAFGEAGGGAVGPDETIVLIVDLVAVR